MELPNEWFDEFWTWAPGTNEEAGASAVRLLAELLQAGVLWRDGDRLCDSSGSRGVMLSPDDQWLIRKIEDAVKVANAAIRDGE